MLYLIFIVQLVLVVIVWSTALEIDCLRAELRKGSGNGGDEALAKTLHESTGALKASIKKDQQV